MPKNSLIHKRVKRRVLGREHLFFAASPPGLKDLCRGELKRILEPDCQLHHQAGGIVFRARLADAYRANLLSRFSSRFLMQLDDFKATSFRRLEQKAEQIPWELYLFSESQLKIRVTARKCRLYHSSAIAERVEAVVRRHLQKHSLPLPPGRRMEQTQQLFVHGRDDRFSLSIDTSGDHLYKRGIKTHGGKAPLRETLAAAALEMVRYDGSEPLIDPMCGSGTFSLEAALTAANMAPGRFRRFAFMDWPSFVQRRWEHIRRMADADIRAAAAPTILAADVDAAACTFLRQTLAKHDLAHRVRVMQRDFFDFGASDWAAGPGVVAINPPYGRRLEKAAGREGLDRIFGHLSGSYRGWRLALVSSRKMLERQLPFTLEVRPISHGGLAAAIAVGRIP